MAEEEEAWLNWRLIKEIILFWGWLRYRASEMIFHCQFVLIDVYIGFIGFIDQRRGC